MLYVTQSQREWHQERVARLARMTIRPIKEAEPVVIHPINITTLPDPCAIDVTCWPPIPGYKPYERKYPSIKSIQLRVCDHFQIGIHDLLSRRRTAVVVMPRHIAIYLCKALTLNSYPEIGRRFGGLDHSSGIHAFRRIERLIQTDPKVSEVVEKIKGALS